MGESQRVQRSGSIATSGVGMEKEVERDNKKAEGSLILGRKSQVCVNNTRGNAGEVSLLRRVWCGGKLSWQFLMLR